MGMEATNLGWVQLREGENDLIIYRNGAGGVSCRTVMVLDRLKGRTVAFCHLKQEIKTLCSLKNHPRRTPLITLNPKMSTIPF